LSAGTARKHQSNKHTIDKPAKKQSNQSLIISHLHKKSFLNPIALPFKICRCIAVRMHKHANQVKKMITSAMNEKEAYIHT
jgi:hypothetical protein